MDGIEVLLHTLFLGYSIILAVGVEHSNGTLEQCVVTGGHVESRGHFQDFRVTVQTMNTPNPYLWRTLAIPLRASGDKDLIPRP